MITNEMAALLIEIYDKTRVSPPRRKKVKIVVDSLLEQLSQKYLKTEPSGIMNLRRDINLILSQYDGHDLQVLNAMKNVLIIYNDVFSTKYTKHDDKLFSFLDEELRTLISLLIDGNYIVNREIGSELGELI